MIDKPGTYVLTAEEYHADPCVQPSLSSSIANILWSSTPRHAWFAHPRLNPAEVEEEEREIFDRGTVAHALLLEGEKVAEVLEYPDWRKNEAKAARQAARDAGKVPILAKHWTDVEAMVQAARVQLAAHKDSSDAFVFEEGKPEQTLIWFDEEFGIWCRARLDWLVDSHERIYDYKSTGMSASQEAVTRMLTGGWDIQAEFYRRGAEAVFGARPEFRFVVQENSAPYQLGVVGIDPSFEWAGQAKVRFAMKRFADCLKSGDWPSYPDRTYYPALPAWEEEKITRMELAE